MNNSVAGPQASSRKRRRLLVLASSASDLVEMTDLAKMLAGTGHQVVFCYVSEAGLSAVSDDVWARIQSMGGFDGRLQAQTLDLTDPSSRQSACAKRSKRERPGLLKRAMSGLMGTIRNHPGFLSLLSVVVCLHRYHRNLKRFRVELRRISCDAILLPEDVVGAVWPVVIKAAHEIDLPSLVFPYTLANQQEAVQSLKDEPYYQTRNNRLITWLAPAWRWRRNGLDLVRLPLGHALAHEWLRISPPDPWMMNSGYANIICVDSQASRDYFLHSGIPQSKLVVTGSISQDLLFAEYEEKEQRLAALRRELGLEGTKPLLLISGCPNQLEGKVPFCQFATMEEIAAHLGRAVSELSSDYHLVVRPHPNYMGFGELLKPWGVVTATIPTSRLVPLSDLFIAFASATIRWAIACAVPTINYDVFHYSYGEFSGASGVRTVSDADEFLVALGGMVQDGEDYTAAKARIIADATHWSMMDGRCAERIDSAIDAACSSGHVLRTSQ